MSYHTHNLERGDIFSGPSDLNAYADGTDHGMPHHLWLVMNTELCSDRDINDRIRISATCLACGKLLDVDVSGEISLCMTEEFGVPLVKKIERWECYY